MTGCTTLKSLHVQHVPTHRVHILLSSAQYNKHDSTYLQRTKPNIEACFDLLAGEGNAGRVSPSILWRRNRWRQLPPRACKPSSEIFWTGSTNTANSATLNHQASKDVCSYLISALKDEVPFETANNTQTMAAAKAAIQTSRCSLHEQELKRITYPIPAATKRTILKWLHYFVVFENVVNPAGSSCNL